MFFDVIVLKNPSNGVEVYSIELGYNEDALDQHYSFVITVIRCFLEG